MKGKQMSLPLRHVWLEFHMPSGDTSEAAFVTGGGQTDRNLKMCPAALWPLQGVCGASVWERLRIHHKWYAELRGWDAAGNDLPTVFLDIHTDHTDQADAVQEGCS